MKHLELTFDPSCDMWYLGLRKMTPGCVDRTVERDGYNLDYDADGELLGVEVFGPLPIEVAGAENTASSAIPIVLS